MAESRLPSLCLKLQDVYDDAVGELAVRKSVGRLQLEPDDRRGARTGEPSDLCVENLQRHCLGRFRFLQGLEGHNAWVAQIGDLRLVTA